MLSLRTCKGTSHGVEGPSPSTNGDPKPALHRQGWLHPMAGTVEPCRSDPSLTPAAIPDSRPDPSPSAPCKGTSPGLLRCPGAHPGSAPQGRAAAAPRPLQALGRTFQYVPVKEAAWRGASHSDGKAHPSSPHPICVFPFLCPPPQRADLAAGPKPTQAHVPKLERKGCWRRDQLWLEMTQSPD